MNAIFQFEDINISPINIQCGEDWKASQVFEKFKIKATSSTTPFDLNDYLFYYNGEKINKDLTIAQIKGNANRNDPFIIIIVKKEQKS